MVVIKGRRPNNLDLTDVEEYDDDLSDDGAPSTIFSSEQVRIISPRYIVYD